MGLFFKKNKKTEDAIDMEKLPNCVAFIIDGNGRWAKKRGMPRMFGHKAGIDAVRDTIENAHKLGIKELIFYCFSTENWNRPKEEVDGLFKLFREFINRDAESYVARGFKISLLGDMSKIPQDIIEKAKIIESKPIDNLEMKVGICVNYGGRNDIVHAVNTLLESGMKNITEKDFSNYLYTHDFSDPDLIIRTSGEQRISNFLLYQMAYSEFYFVDTYWPDFDEQELKKAIINFQKRNRRFGAIKE